MLRQGEGSNRVDVVFETYRDISIKSAQRELRGESDAITFKNLAAGQKVKEFKNFLRNGDSKTSLIRFVVKHWQRPPSRERLEDKELHVTCTCGRKPTRQDRCRESSGRRRAKIRTRGG